MRRALTQVPIGSQMGPRVHSWEVPSGRRSGGGGGAPRKAGMSRTWYGFASLQVGSSCQREYLGRENWATQIDPSLGLVLTAGVEVDGTPGLSK